MQAVVVVGIEDGQEDEAACATYREEYTDTRQRRLCAGCVGRESTVVSQPALGREGQVEEYGCDHSASDEERLQSEGPDVGDIGDLLVC